jgi:hypothetical protein
MNFLASALNRFGVNSSSIAAQLVSSRRGATYTRSSRGLEGCTTRLNTRGGMGVALILFAFIFLRSSCAYQRRNFTSLKKPKA